MCVLNWNIKIVIVIFHYSSKLLNYFSEYTTTYWYNKRQNRAWKCWFLDPFLTSLKSGSESFVDCRENNLCIIIYHFYSHKTCECDIFSHINVQYVLYIIILYTLHWHLFLPTSSIVIYGASLITKGSQSSNTIYTDIVHCIV